MRIWSLVLVFCTILTMLSGVLFAVSATEVELVDASTQSVQSGMCGENVAWELDSSGTLTISGSGKMFDYDNVSPWYEYEKMYPIKSVMIADGVTYIGKHSFIGCSNVTSVSIPNSVTEIGCFAFDYCSALTSITLPSNLINIGAYAFNGCSSLKEITISSSVLNLGDGVFERCWDLSEITFIGDAPTMCVPNSARYEHGTFCNITATIYYPSYNSTWTSDVIDKTYGGKISWIAYADSIDEDVILDSQEKIRRFLMDEYGVASQEQFVSCLGSDIQMYPSNIYGVVSQTWLDIDSDCNDELVVLRVGPNENNEEAHIIAEIYQNSNGKAVLLISQKIYNISFSAAANIYFFYSDKLGKYCLMVDTESYGSYTGVNSWSAYIFELSKESIAECTSWNRIPRFGIDDDFISGFEEYDVPYGKYCVDYDDLNNESYYMPLCEVEHEIYGDSSSYVTREHKLAIKQIGDKNYNSNKCIAVLTTEKSLSVEVGDSLSLGFGVMLVDEGLLEGDWKSMAVAVSDPSVVSLSDYKENEYGYDINVTGLKEGSTNLTVTDTDSGLSTIIKITVYNDYTSTRSYKVDDMPEFYPNNKFEFNIATNIYNLNGLYVNNYTYTQETDGDYIVTFDAYNSRYHNAAVDIYDENGMWLGYEEIKKYSDISNLWETGEQAFYLISEIAAYIPGGKESSLLTYVHPSFSKHTPIEIEVPKGGYFTISNNITESPGAFFINALEILFEGTYAAMDLALSSDVKNSALSGFKDSAKVSFANRLIAARNEGLKNNVKREAQKIMINTMTSEVKGVTKKFSKANMKDQLSQTDDMYNELAVIAENYLGAFDIKWKHLAQTSIGVVQSGFEIFAGPAGWALKGCFAMSKGSNLFLMGVQMAASTNKAFATVYTDPGTDIVYSNGIVVNTDGNTASEAVLQVFRVSNEDIVDVILDSNNPLEKHELYNICFVKDDKLVQPNGKVKVLIPIPAGVKGDSCIIYRQETDGSWTVLDAHIEGNYLVFETDHFSLYAIVGDVADVSIATLPTKTTYILNDTLDADGLSLNIDGEIVSEGFVCSPSVLGAYGAQTITVRYGKLSTTFDVIVDEEPVDTYILGDANGDGVVNVKDATLIQKATASLVTLDEVANVCADVNGDGKVNVKDVTAIQKYVARLETGFSIGEPVKKQ